MMSGSRVNQLGGSEEGPARGEFDPRALKVATEMGGQLRRANEAEATPAERRMAEEISRLRRELEGSKRELEGFRRAARAHTV